MLAPPGEKDGLPVNEAFTLRGHDGPVLGVRFNKAGTYCLSCGKVGYTLWHVMQIFCTPHSQLNCLILSMHGSHIYVLQCRTGLSSFGTPTRVT